jgi:hypothetical protein
MVAGLSGYVLSRLIAENTTTVLNDRRHSVVSPFRVSATGEPIFSRVLPGGWAKIGDYGPSDNYGSQLLQLDLPVAPGATLPSGTTFTFSVPTMTNNEGKRAYSAGPDAKCIFGASFRDPTYLYYLSTKGMPMRYSYHYNDFAGEADYSTDISSDAILVIDDDGATMTLHVTTTTDFDIPTFFNNAPVDDSQTRRPAYPCFEVFCGDLYYPSVYQPPGISHVTVNGPGLTPLALDAELGELGGAREPAVARIAPSGYSARGDNAFVDHTGGILLEVDLAEPAGNSISGIDINFSLLSKRISEIGKYEYTVASTSGCVFRGAFVDTTTPMTTELRDLWYIYKNEGVNNLGGDDIRVTTVVIGKISPESTYSSGKVDIVLDMSGFWQVPDFLGGEYAPDGYPWKPVLQIYCYGFYYPDLPQPAIENMSLMVLGGKGREYFVTDAVTYSPLTVGPPGISRAAPGGYAYFGDDPIAGNYGTLYAQMDLPLAPGRKFLANTVISFAVPIFPSMNCFYIVSVLNKPHIHHRSMILHFLLSLTR